MSLVNEALKRTEEEKRQRLAGATPPGPPGADYGSPPRAWLGRLLIIVCAVLAVGTLVAYGVLWVAGQVTQEATAGVNDLTEQSAASLEQGPAEAAPAALESPRQEAQPAPGPATQEPPAGSAAPSNPTNGATAPREGPQIDPDVVKQIAQSLMSQMRQAAAAETPAKDDVEPPPVGGEAVAPEPSGPQTVLKVGEPTPAAPEPKAAPPQAQAKPEPSPPPVDTSRFKVSSIVSGPHGGTAIINGRPVRVGDTVAGAKIIKIAPRSVEVEIDGRRATLALG
ncbi:MAG TPA: hypothetical protein VM238_09930 [Phycisphaerae bacterium]|nr:hypothetical protein [Phycisphaerae bacterium]